MKKSFLPLFLCVLLCLLPAACGEENAAAAENPSYSFERQRIEMTKEEFPIPEETIRRDMEKFWGPIDWGENALWIYTHIITTLHTADAAYPSSVYDVSCFIPHDELPLQFGYGVSYNESGLILDTFTKLYLIHGWDVLADEEEIALAREGVTSYLLNLLPGLAEADVIFDQAEFDKDAKTILFQVSLPESFSLPAGLSNQFKVEWKCSLRQVTDIHFYPAVQ